MTGQEVVNRSSSLGWIYVVVSDTRSPGPRQPVPSWLPGSAVATYGSLLTVVGILLNVTVLCSSLTAGKSSTVPPLRRLLTANLAVVQLTAAVLVIPAGAVTEAVGGWVFGGQACRAWLVGQVLLIAGMMWSVVALDVHCFLRQVAPRRCYAVQADHHPRAIAGITVVSSWVVAGLASLPIGLAVGTRQADSSKNVNTPVLEDVCAINLGRADVVAQSLTAFLLPGAVGLVSVLKMVGVKGRRECLESVMAVAGVSAACVLLWSPFFVLYVLLPFCGDRLCVDPAMWTLFAWLGHSSVVVSPSAWLIDSAVRSDVRHFASLCRRRCCCRGSHDNVTSSASSLSDGHVVDESSGLMSVTKYQIHRPSEQHRRSPTDGPSELKLSA